MIYIRIRSTNRGHKWGCFHENLSQQQGRWMELTNRQGLQKVVVHAAYEL